jgi:periplasmic divalent cation tolerance protein
MESFLQVITTTESREEAKIIARHLIDAQLAACVQIWGPVESTYRWKGKVETAEEWICLIKTREDLYKKLEKAVISLHSYDTPEIIALPIIKGSADYLQWLDDTLAGD